MFHALLFSYRKEKVERGTGAHRIASFLREAGWDIEVIDFCSEWSLEELKELVISRVNSNTKFFGFSSFINYWNDDANIFTGWLKSVYPDITTVIGGQGVLLTPAKNIDYWVDSFGELAILELCKKLTTNTSNVIVEQIEEKNVIRSLVNHSAWKLPSFQNKHEKRDFIQPFEMLTIETSRGCKFKCSFCNFPILGIQEDTSRSADDLRAELQFAYDEYGIKNYTFADETFNDRTEKIIKYADMVQTLDFQPWFMAFMRADLMIHHRQYWDHIKAMGLGGHFYGVETLNHESGKIIGKGMHPEKLKQGLLDMRKFLEPEGIYRGTVSLICGLPKESPETFADGINWCKENWKDQSVASWYLEVPEYNSPMSNLSAFSLNLEKYGLRRKELIDKPNKFTNYLLTSYFPSLESINIWEHDDMDQLQAMEILDDFFENIFPKYFTNSGFSCVTGLIEDGTNEIKDILSKRRFDDNAKSIDTFIKTYKERKLGWTHD